MKKQLQILAAAGAFLLSGTAACTIFPQTEIVRNFYSLSFEIDVPAREIPTIPLKKIAVPEYLEKKQIAVLGNDGKLFLSEKNLWAEPISSTLKRVLPLQISAHLAKVVPAAKIESLFSITILQLVGNLGGNVEIQASIEIFGNEKNPETKTFFVKKSVPVDEKNFESYVAATSKLVDEFALSVAEILSKKSSENQ